MKPTLIIYLILITAGAVLPINGTNSALNNNYILSIRWDYILHALVYLPAYAILKGFKFKVSSLEVSLKTLALSLSKGPNFKTSKPETSKPQNLKPQNLKLQNLKSLIAAILLAISLEAVQYILPYRSFNLNDLLANVLGVGTGVLLWILLKNRIIKNVG